MGRLVATLEHDDNIDHEAVLRDQVNGALGDLHTIDDHVFASQRTSADQIEHEVRSRLLREHDDFSPPSGARQPADVRWRRFHINIKSMDLARSFHMPNLVSADSLWRLLERGDHFMLLRLAHRNGKIENWDFWNIQDISWQHLTLGALGAGQIQIKNALLPLTAHQGSRDTWRQQWRERMIEFYEHERVKIDKRMIKWSNR